MKRIASWRFFPAFCSGRRRDCGAVTGKRIATGETSARNLLRGLRRARIVFLAISILVALPGTGAPIQATPPTSPSPLEFTVQTGHTAEIHGLQYASTGAFFASAGKDSTIKVWSPAGTLIRTIHTGFWVDYFALSHDSQIFLAASRMGNIFMLGLDGHVVHRLPNVPLQQGFVSSVALSDDNRYAAIGTTKGLLLYRLEVAAEIRLPTEGGDSSDVGSVLFTHDGRLISGHEDGKLRFWTNEGKLLRTIAAHDYSIRALALSPDGKMLATAGMPAIFADSATKLKPFTKLWDLEGNSLGQFPSHFTQCLRFTADGEALVSGGRFDNHVNIYRRSGELLRTINVGADSEHSPYLVALSPDGHGLITADNHFNPPGLEILTMDGGFERSISGLSGTGPGPGSGPMTNVALSPDGNIIVTVSADRLVRLWSLTGRLAATLEGHKEYPTALAYAPNGLYFASGGDEVILRDRFGQKMGEVGGFKSGAGVLAFTPDSRFLFCGDGDGNIHIYDLKEKTVRLLKVHDDSVTALAIHPSGKYFATGSFREDVRIWDMDGKLQGESRYEGKSSHPVSAAFALAFSPDGERLVAATTNPDKSLQIFDLKAHLVDAIKSPNAYQGGAIAFSKSGHWFAETVNNTVVLWDWPAHKIVRILKGHGDHIEGLSFTPDEERLVTAGRDATTRVWRIDNGYSMTMLSHGSDWIVYTPDGYFDASHYGGDLVAITQGLETFGVDQFALRLNRPDIILSRMGIGSPEFIEHLRSRYQLRLERSGFTQGAPGLSLEAPKVHLLQSKQEGKFVQIEALINDQHYPLKSYQIYVNNVPVFSGRGKPVDGLTTHVNDRIELSQGDNKIEISAFNSQGIEALRAHSSAIYRPASKVVVGDLYYIGFGVSHYRNPALNLQYAHKDVLDLGAAMQRYTGSFRHVIAKTYTDEAVTPENIRKAGDLLKNASVDDTIVILVSGHGVYDLSKEATYYYGTYTIDVKNLAATAVSFDQIESLLRDIAPRRKLLLLDTCESGEMDEATRNELAAKMKDVGLAARTTPALQQARTGQTKRVFLYDRDRYIYNDLARRTGSVIFSASHAGEMSFESPKIQNGYFTHELLEALRSNQADANRDGQISMDELEAFVSLNVALKTGGLQRPTVDRDNINQRFSFPLLP